MRDDKTAVKKVLALGALGLALAAAILALCLRIGGGGFVGSGLEGGGSVYYQRARDTGGRIDGIVIGVEGLTGGFKPEAVAAPGDRAVSDSVYEPLVSVGPDGQPVSVLAREIGISEDGLTYTVSLREGVAFQDGQPLLAEDAVASVLACAGRQTRHERFLAGLVGYEDYVNGRANSLAGVQAAGEGTVTFTFVVPSPGNIWALGVGTQKAAEIGNGGVYNGTGPYRLAGWDHAGREARLSPNEAYRGKAPAGDITLREIDLASGAALYQAGEIDALAFSYDSQALAALGEIEDIDIYQSGGGDIIYLGLNCDEGRLGQSVRRALAWALDRAAIVAEAYGDGGEVMELPISAAAYVSGGGKGITRYRHDQKRALTSLGEAGYAGDEAGRLVGADGGQLRLTAITLDSDLYMGIMRRVAAQLGELGIEVTVRAMSYGDFRTALYRDRDFDLYLSSWRGGAEGDVSRFGRGSGSGAEGWADEAAYGAVEAIEGSATYKESLGAYKEFWRLYSEAAAQIPLAAPKRFVAARHSVRGIELSPCQTPFWNLGEWRVR